MDDSSNYSLRRERPASIEVPEGQIRVLESHHAPGFSMETGVWPFHKIAWVAVGKGNLEGPGLSFDIQRNDFLLLPGNWPHRFVDHSREPLTLVILCVSAEYISFNRNTEIRQLWQDGLGEAETGRPRCAKTPFHQSRLVEAFRETLNEQEEKRSGWQTALQSIADRLLLLLRRGYTTVGNSDTFSSMQSVIGAIEYMKTHPQESLQIADMAERCDLSPRRFTQLFKQRTGTTFNHYLNQTRIDFACRRLHETDHILYACYESGFNDLAYFYRVFKKYTDLTPGQFISRNEASNARRKTGKT